MALEGSKDAFGSSTAPHKVELVQGHGGKEREAQSATVRTAVVGSQQDRVFDQCAGTVMRMLLHDGYCRR